ncbi:MAG: PH domain-containing protein [Xanthobacteraceae bacterium]
MSYVEKVLQPGEKVGYQASLHWVTYLHGLLWLVAAAVVWMVLPGQWLGGLVTNTVVILLAACGVFFLGQAWFEWWITEIAITNRRVIYKHGLVSRQTDEMPVDKIETVQVDQSILGRILGYGRVTIRGTGGGGGSLGTLDAPIAAPLEFRNHITGA